MNGRSTLLWLSMLAFSACPGKPAEATDAPRPPAARARVKSLRATVIRTYTGTDCIVVQDRSGYEFLCRLQEVQLTCLNRRVSRSVYRNGDAVVVRGQVEAF